MIYFFLYEYVCEVFAYVIKGFQANKVKAYYLLKGLRYKPQNSFICYKKWTQGRW